MLLELLDSMSIFDRASRTVRAESFANGYMICVSVRNALPKIDMARFVSYVAAVFFSTLGDQCASTRKKYRAEHYIDRFAIIRYS